MVGVLRPAMNLWPLSYTVTTGVVPTKTARTRCTIIVPIIIVAVEGGESEVPMIIHPTILRRGEAEGIVISTVYIESG